MIVTVSFPIRNSVYIHNPWPIHIGARSYLVTVKEGKAQSVSVRTTGAPVASAPRIEKIEGGKVTAEIKSDGSAYVLFAEYDLRAWQSLLSPYEMIDIDFDNPTTKFEPEKEAEKAGIKIHNWSFGKQEVRYRGKEEFAIYGRAFLILDEGRPLIEEMSLYREAEKDFRVERYIDAYNRFYLYLETKLCDGRTGTDQATDRLMRNVAFVSALKNIATSIQKHPKFKKLRFKHVQDAASDPRPLAKELVEMRGALRHHSLKSPHRWNPNRQDDYEIEARFIAQLCFAIAFPETTGKLFERNVLDRFVQLAKESHMSIDVIVRMTIRISDRAQDVGLNMTFPQQHADAMLSTAVLRRALEELETRSPGAELFAVRATIKSTGTELFRYDLGPGIERGSIP